MKKFGRILLYTLAILGVLILVAINFTIGLGLAFPRTESPSSYFQEI